jgi:hypothetical protein
VTVAELRRLRLRRRGWHQSDSSNTAADFSFLKKC